MYFGCCIYVLLLLNMPEMAHDWINKSILFYSILFYLLSFLIVGLGRLLMHLTNIYLSIEIIFQGKIFQMFSPV